MKKFTDFYESYWFLYNHKYFEHPFWKESSFDEGVHITVVKVNPENNRIEDNDLLNTKTQVWLEAGCIEGGCIEDGEYEELIRCHDIDLDCGGDTYEEAIIKLANLVLKNYGE